MIILPPNIGFIIHWTIAIIALIGIFRQAKHCKVCEDCATDKVTPILLYVGAIGNLAVIIRHYIV